MNPRTEKNLVPYDKPKVLADPASLCLLDKMGEILYFSKEC